MTERVWTEISLMAYYGGVALMREGQRVYLTLENYDGMHAIELTPEEAALATPLFASIGNRKSTILSDPE